MKKAIAKIKLAPGNVAWYDPLNNIYLTMESNEAIIYDSFDLTNIKKGIKYNILILLIGKLTKNIANEDKIKKGKVVTKKEIKKEIHAKNIPKEKRKSNNKKEKVLKKEASLPIEKDDIKIKKDKIDQVKTIVEDKLFNTNKNNNIKEIE